MPPAAPAQVAAACFVETGDRPAILRSWRGRKWLVLGSIRDDHGLTGSADPSRPDGDGLAGLSVAQKTALVTE
jgi:hypothetical protein